MSHVNCTFAQEIGFFFPQNLHCHMWIIFIHMWLPFFKCGLELELELGLELPRMETDYYYYYYYETEWNFLFHM